jgi:hypothetical protein
MNLSPRITRVIENVLVAAITAIIILVWQPTRDIRQEVSDRVRPFKLWQDQNKEAWNKLIQQRPSLSDVQFGVSGRDGVIFVSLPKLSDEDELAVHRFILENPPSSPVRLRRIGVATK